MARASPTASAAHTRARLSLASPAAQLVLAAAVFAALFAIVFVAAQPIWAGRPTRPASSTAPDVASVGWPGVALMLVFMLGTAGLFRPYHLAQVAVTRAGSSPRMVLVLTLVLASVACLMYPAYGSDVFDYAGFERMWVVYADNPLLALPINHPDDWATQLVWYPDRTPAYGPLWAILSWPIVRLAGDSPSAIVAGYKILSIVAYALCCWLIWTSVEPTRRTRALVLFAWSPLVLFEVLGKVHNDVLPALAMLAGVWLFTRRRSLETLSLAAVTAGGLVKVTALAFAPAVLVYLWRHGRWRACLPALLAAVVLALACYAPFWDGSRTLASIWNQTSRIVWSPASLLIVAAAAWLPGGSAAAPVIRGLLGVLWLAITARLVLHSRLDRPTHLATLSGWVLLSSILLLTSAVFAHYLVPAVALAAVSDSPRLQRAVFWLSLGGLGAYYVEFLSLTLGRDWLGSDAYRVLGSVILLGPLARVAMDRSRASGSPPQHG